MEIGDKKILRRYYSVLYRLTGVNIDFASERGEVLKLCDFEHYNAFCKLIQACPDGKERCHRESMETLRKVQATGEPVIYECHAGLIDIAIPLFVNKRFIGCLTTGQLSRNPPTPAGFDALWKKVKALRVDRDALREAYFATPAFSGDKLDALVELVSMIGNYIMESENKLLFLESFQERDRITAVRGYIEKHYREKLSVADAAALARTSESHFGHLFKAQVGVSFVQYLNRYRTEKAKELLRNSKSSVTAIADAVGFQNLPHFNRIFRKFERCSPLAYRKAESVKRKAGKA